MSDVLQTALVQDYDGLLRIAPAWPKDWDADATVNTLHRGKVHLQIRKGELLTVGIESGANTAIRIRNPWAGRNVEVVDARTGVRVAAASTAPILVVPVRMGGAYTVRRVGGVRGVAELRAIAGERAVAPKSLGSRSIGIAR